MTRTRIRLTVAAGPHSATAETAVARSRIAAVRKLLLAWYAEHARDLPWRRTRDPYAILVSEVMLQQTQVERVVPRYLRWLERWRTPAALAAASPAEAIVEWQGLGYNRRAVNLQRAARAVAERGWPDDLTDLPGVGPYTARRRQLRLRARRAPGRHERAPRPGTHGRELRRRVRTGAVRPRRDDLPRPHPALRCLPARHDVSLSRPSHEPARKQSRFEGSFRERRALALRRRRGRAAGGRGGNRVARARRARRGRRAHGVPAR